MNERLAIAAKMMAAMISGQYWDTNENKMAEVAFSLADTLIAEGRKSEGEAERHKAHQEKIALSREARVPRSDIWGVCPHCGEKADPEKSWQHKDDCPLGVPF